MPSKRGPLYGSPTPRLHTPTLDRLPSRGEELAELADAIGLPLLPWQRWVVDDACRIGPDGRWARSTLGVIVARQNGKTHLVRMRILAGLFLWGERSIVAMAQNRALSLDTFREVVSIVEANPWLSKHVRRVSRTNGQEELELRSGQKYQVVAATKEGPRGKTADLLYVDELREIAPEAWAAARPVTRARPNPQTWVTSNAGDATSIVLNELRTRALAGESKKVGWYEWSAEPTAAIDDRTAWSQANPALGHLITEEALAESAATDHPDAFRTEALCLWVDQMDSPWPADVWDACAVPGLELESGVPTYLAIDVTPDRRTAALVAGQARTDGRISGILLETWSSDGAVDDQAIAADVSVWVRKLRPQVIGFDRYTGSAIAARLAATGVPVADVSGPQFVQACDELLSAMVAGRLAHPAQDVLTSHVASCARKPAADGGWRIVRRSSAGAVCAAVGLAMVVHHASAPRKVASIHVA
jgi:hypothetical protein